MVDTEIDQAILSIIGAAPVRDQQMLLTRLRARNINVSQPTLSRHLRNLSIQKIQGRYRRAPLSAQVMQPYQIVALPPNLLVLKTTAGRAQLLGTVIDKANLSEVAGTVAGDDTLLIAVSPEISLEVASHALETLLGPQADSFE